MRRSSFLRLIRAIAVILAVALIVAYAVWRSLSYARGPNIVIIEPPDGATIVASTVAIRGRVDRVNGLLLNGNPIFIDERGNFSETVVVFPGMNTITFVAHDRFERTTEARLRLFGL
jgi:hypothetical protein